VNGSEQQTVNGKQLRAVNRESLMEGNSNQQTAISKYKILCMGAMRQD